MKAATCRRWAAVGVAALALGLFAPTAQADDEWEGQLPPYWPWDSQMMEENAWTYFYYGQGFNRAYLDPAKDDSAWTYWDRGTAPIGFGSSYNRTQLVSRDGTRPVTAYFRTSLIGGIEAGRWTGARLTFIADDGAAIYIDGKEVARANLPAGPLTDSTLALSAPTTEEARAHPVVVDLPLSALAGPRELTAEVHAAGRTTKDMSFYATVELIPNKDRVVVPAGSAWNYRYDGGTPPSDWKTRCYLETGHSRTAPLGFGTPAVATNIDVKTPSARPLTAYFCYRSEPLYTDRIGDLQITTWANDGLVLYVNGKEVKRVNMPAGPVTNTTYATAAPWAALAYRNPVTVTIPHKDLLGSDTVSIAAETHLNWRGTTDIYFDLIARSVPTE